MRRAYWQVRKPGGKDVAVFILGDKWCDGYLDYYRGADDLRITVCAWRCVSPVTDVYFVRHRSIRMVWNYIGEFGVRAVLRKIFSRLRESLRNQRVLAVGLGRICQTGAVGEWEVGTPVAFVAPCHPRCVERVVVQREFVRKVDEELLARVTRPGEIRWLEQGPEILKHDAVAGWDPRSGTPVPSEALNLILDESISLWDAVEPNQNKFLPRAQPTPIQERTPSPPRRKEGKRAVLFGLGNYAKTVLLRFLDPRIHVECVHELDPAQLGHIDKLPWEVDASPLLRPDREYDAYLIAGYHHTHNDLAIAALRRGAYAIVTKPLVTDQAQLERLLVAMRAHPERYFACYPMRHNPLWTYAREDLGVAPGDPIHYYCIVYEAPLPLRHWYRWPNSGSRLISNGCHWIDHFLFMNDFQPVKCKDVRRFMNGDLCVNVELVNGAAFSMVLTDHGSVRIGMQQYVEMRANDVTIRVRNASRYSAEGPHGMLRGKRIPRQGDARRMYQIVSKKVADEASGDKVEHIEKSCRLVLDLEDQLRSEYDITPRH